MKWPAWARAGHLLVALLLVTTMSSMAPAGANGNGVYFGAGSDADPNLAVDTTVAASGDTNPVTIRAYASLTLNGYALTFTDSTTIVLVQGTLDCGAGGALNAGRPSNGAAQPSAQGNQGRGGAGGNGGGSLVVLAKRVTGSCHFSVNASDGAAGGAGGTVGTPNSGNAGVAGGNGRTYTTSFSTAPTTPTGGSSGGTGGTGGTAAAAMNTQRWSVTSTFLSIPDSEWQWYGQGGTSGSNGATNNLGTGGAGGAGGAGGSLASQGGAGGNGGTATGASTGGGGGGAGGSAGVSVVYTEDNACASIYQWAAGGAGGQGGNANSASGGHGGPGAGGAGGVTIYMGPRAYASITQTATGGAAGAAATIGTAGTSATAGLSGISRNIQVEPYETQNHAAATYDGQSYANATWESQLHANSSIPAGGRTFYLSPSIASDIAGYTTAQSTPPTTPEFTVSQANTGTSFTLVRTFATPAGEPNVGVLPPGVFSHDVYAKVNNGEATIKIETYKRTAGGVETLLHSATSGTFSNDVTALIHWHASDANAYAMSLSDRLVWKLYTARVSGPATVTVTLYFEDGDHASSLHTTLGGVAASGVGNAWFNATGFETQVHANSTWCSIVNCTNPDPFTVSAHDVLVGEPQNMTLQLHYDNGTARTGAASNVSLYVLNQATGTIVVNGAHPTELILGGTAFGYYYYTFTPTTSGLHVVVANQTTAQGEARSSPATTFRVEPDTYGLLQHAETLINATKAKVDGIDANVSSANNTASGAVTQAYFNAWRDGEARPAFGRINDTALETTLGVVHHEVVSGQNLTSRGLTNLGDRLEFDGNETRSYLVTHWAQGALAPYVPPSRELAGVLFAGVGTLVVGGFYHRLRPVDRGKWIFAGLLILGAYASVLGAAA